MKRIGLLVFLVGLPLLAAPPDFSANYRFTNRLGEPTDGKAVYNGATRSIALDNTAMGCSGFQINYASEGLTGVSVNLQTNTKIWFGGLSFGVGPTWSTFGGTATTGSLPMTSTTSGLYVGYGSYPYVAINVATFTGTGSIDVTFSCWKSITYAQAIGGGGGGGTFPATTNFIAGTAAPNVGADSGIAPGSVALLNAVNSQSGTTYTLQSSDNGNTVNFTSNSAVTVTIPTGLTVGFVTTLVQSGTGLVSPTASGTTFTTSASTNGVGSSVTVLSTSTNTYLMFPSGPTTTILTCQPGLGDGLNAISAGTYLQTSCLNEFTSTWTITAIKCYTDNAGTSALSVTNSAGTALLTGAITCASSFAAGTQSATTTLPVGDYAKFSFVADGTSKQTTFVITGTR